MSPGEKSDILEYLEKGKSIKEAAIEFGRDPSSISELVRAMRPTTALARATLKAKASELVDRVLEKADVDQLLDVLSRPNLGVLESIPNGKMGGGPIQIGVAVSVAPGSLPAVNEAEFIEGQRRLNPQPDDIAVKPVKIGSGAEIYTS